MLPDLGRLSLRAPAPPTYRRSARRAARTAAVEEETSMLSDVQIKNRVRSDLRKIVANGDQSLLAATTTIREYIKTVPPGDFAVFDPETRQMVYKIANLFPGCLLDVDVRRWLHLPSLATYAPSFRKGLRVHVDEEPRELHALPLHRYMELRVNAKAMCEGARPVGMENIASDFIDTQLLSTDNLVWLLLVGNTIHGYAVAEEVHDIDRRTLHVHVICSDRGGGYKLFSRIASYAQEAVDTVEIEPLNDDLESLYQEWGEDFGLVFGTGMYGRTLYASVNGEDDDDDDDDSHSNEYD